MACTRVLFAALSLSLPIFAPSIMRADPIPLPGAVAGGVLTIPYSSQSQQVITFGENEITFNEPLGPPYGALQTYTDLNTDAVLGQDPVVSALISIGNVTATELEEGQFNGTTAQSSLSYSFIVNGPGSALVPIDISATGGATAPSGDSGAAAVLSITSSTGAVLLDDAACTSLIGAIPSSCLTIGPPQSQFSLADQIFYVQPNQVYTVDLLAEATIVSFPLPNTFTPGLQQVSGGDAYIDPTIALDSSAGSQYSLTFSPGVAPTPEPNYLPIMLPCLAGMVLWLKSAKGNSIV